MTNDLLRTSLYDHHLALKAKMSPFAGYAMPVQYSSVKEEVLAVRERVGVFDVSHMGEFFVTGPDAVAFVDSLLTNDFQKAPVAKAVYSPLCREDGTVIDDLIAYKIREDHVLICVNASNIKKDWDWFQAHHKNFQCELSNQSNDYSLLAVQGPRAVETLSKLGLEGLEQIEYYGVKEQAPWILARTGYTGEDGFEIFGPHDKIAALWEQLIQAGVAPCGLAARDVLRLEVCYPLYGHELTDQLTPLDAGLKWTVKLDKGEFIGRQALLTAKPRFRLARLSLAKGIPREGYAVLDGEGKAIGEVTSGTMSVSQNCGICMALIQKDHWPADDQFLVQIRQQTYPARLHKKAFHTGGHK